MNYETWETSKRTGLAIVVFVYSLRCSRRSPNLWNLFDYLGKMGGVRNGRALRLVLATAVAVVFALYVVYLYHSAKGELEEAHNRLEAINKIHERLTKELKGR